MIVDKSFLSLLLSRSDVGEAFIAENRGHVADVEVCPV